MNDAVMEPHPKTALIRRPVSIFCSYAHSDERFRVELDKHLSVMRRNGEIDEWHDRNISAGTEWKISIDKHLNAAEIILLLVSADFLASDYCYEIEMRRAMERHESGKACVIPIILRDCDWSSAPFSKLQALPKNAKPIKKWSSQDEAYHDIVVGIRNVIRQLRASPAAGPADSFRKKRTWPAKKTLLAVAILPLTLFGAASYLAVSRFARQTNVTNQPAGKPEQTTAATQSAEKSAAPATVPETREAPKPVRPKEVRDTSTPPPPVTNTGAVSETVLVSGFVYDAAGVEIEGAKVTLVGLANSTPDRTSSHGRFIFDKVPGKKGDFVEIEVTKDGYVPYRDKYIIGLAIEIKLDKKQ